MGVGPRRDCAVAGVLLVVLGGGCADEPEGSSTTAWETATGSSGTGGSTGDEGAGCELECNDAPGECYEPDASACADGTCEYTPKLAGEPCTEGCEGGGYCDAGGMCICASGGCDTTCTAGPNATAMCDPNGECIRTCEAPWENCDGDWANGCEIPVGITGVCDGSGINMEGGCWTAYCGESEGPDAHNFGTFYCVDCSTCNAPSAGMCRWCNRDTGNWYPAEACDCGMHLDLACNP